MGANLKRDANVSNYINIGYNYSMFQRVIHPILTKSFFLFGARGVGKSTFLKSLLKGKRVMTYDLLDPEIENRLILSPQDLRNEVLVRVKKLDWVVIDEVQKCPRLLNVVHKLIVEEKVKFALSGSSARRLREKGSNLLAGRAIHNEMFPLTYLELKDSFRLDDVLMYGSLPEVITASNSAEKQGFLRTYALNYLKLEVQAEQWVRKMEPFRRFLPIAAQMNGKILNYSNIAKDIGVQTQTVQNYYDILEDTLVGIRIPGFHRSVRKQQHHAPKFYFFDLGVRRALDRTLDVLLKPETFAFGEAFEHLVFIELYRLSVYRNHDFEFSYLLTKDGAEIDLVVDRPGRPVALVEIKSKTRVDERDTASLEHFRKDFHKPDLFVLSNDPNPKKIGHVRVLPWKQGIGEILND